ncbi:unnamed protein product [Symbiodinium sp. CCMP2592]|nr:unnamed protein product [Symbiodinium sp. CCMP2592]
MRAIALLWCGLLQFVQAIELLWHEMIQLTTQIYLATVFFSAVVVLIRRKTEQTKRQKYLDMIRMRKQASAWAAMRVGRQRVSWGRALIRKSNRWKRAASETWKEIKWSFRKEDWVEERGSDVLFSSGPADLANQLDVDEGRTWVVQVEMQDEALEILNMIAATVGGSIAVILAGSHPSKIEELDPAFQEFGSSATRIKVPGHLDGRLQARTCWIFRFGPEQPILRTRIAMKLPAGVQSPSAARPSWVLRLACQWHYNNSDWKRVLQSPGPQARKWATSAFPESRQELGDTWAWQEVHAGLVQGLLRVHDQSLAQQLLAHSGSSNDFGTWFVEAVGEYPGDNQATKVLWIPWINPETWDEYLTRVRQEGSFGVVRGAHQLGVRVSPRDTRWKEPAHKWTIRWVPKAWTTHDVSQVLMAMGYQDASITGKSLQRPGASWYFSARRGDGLQSVQAEMEIGAGEKLELQAMMDAKWRAAPISSARGLQPEKRVSYRDVLPVAEVAEGTYSYYGARKSPDLHMEVETEETISASREVIQQDGEPLQLDAGIQPETKGAKRAAETHQPQRAAAMAKCTWMPTGKILRNSGQGDCLYHSLAQALNHAGEVARKGEERSHRQIRAFTTAAFKKWFSHYEELWLGQGKPDARGQQQEDGTFQAYVDQQQMLGVWSGALEVLAFAEAFNIRVWVATSKGEVRIFNENARNAGVYLFYSDCHYECLQDAREEEFIRRKREQDEAGGKGHLTALMRGGVGSLRLSDFGSVNHESNKRSHDQNSLRLSDFASTKKSRTKNSGADVPVREAGTTKSSPMTTIHCDGGNQQHLGSSCTIHRRGSSIAGSHSEMSHAEQDKSSKTGICESHVWVCNVCHMLCRASLRPMLSAARHRHIQKVHPNEDRKKFHRLNECTVIPTLSKKALGKRMVWECAWCHQGLPRLHRTQAKASIKSHLASCKKAPEGADQKLNRSIHLSKAGLTERVTVNSLYAARMLQFKSRESKVLESLRGGGHKIVEVLHTSQRRRYTCSNCTRYWKSISAIQAIHFKCKGKDDRRQLMQSKGRRRLWGMAQLKNKRKLQSIWKLSHSEVKQLNTTKIRPRASGSQD